MTGTRVLVPENIARRGRETRALGTQLVGVGGIFAKTGKYLTSLHAQTKPSKLQLYLQARINLSLVQVRVELSIALS